MRTIPVEVDIDAIRAQLAQDGVAATDPKLDAALQGVVGEASARGVEDMKIVVLDWQPDSAILTRDIAQKILDADGGTVVVRAPQELVAVSDQYSRAAIESAQNEGIRTWDYTMGMSDFVDELVDWTLPYAQLNLIALAVLLIIVAGLPLLWWRRARAAA